MSDFKENCLEWLTGQDRITVSLAQKKFINRILKLAEDKENGVEIVAKNADGSNMAHLPIRALHFFILPQNTKRPPWLSDLPEEDEDDEEE